MCVCVCVCVCVCTCVCRCVCTCVCVCVCVCVVIGGLKSLALFFPPRSTTAAGSHVQHISVEEHGKVQEILSPQKVRFSPRILPMHITHNGTVTSFLQGSTEACVYGTDKGKSWECKPSLQYCPHLTPLGTGCHSAVISFCTQALHFADFYLLMRAYRPNMCKWSCICFLDVLYCFV